MTGPDRMIDDARLAGLGVMYRRLNVGRDLAASGLTFEGFVEQHARFDEREARTAIRDEARRLRGTFATIRRLACGRA